MAVIKGVNRQMIEILDTGNPYFERALFVVQADMAATDGDTLHREALSMLKSADGYSELRIQRRRRWLGRLSLILLSGGGGALLALLLQALLRL